MTPPDQAQALSGRKWLLFFTAFLAIYAAFPTHDYYWDGIGFAQSIEDAGHGTPFLFQANHLLYNWIGFALYRTVCVVWPVRALYILQGLNMVCGSAAACTILGLLRRLGTSPRMQACFVCFFAFSLTWWRFATDADAYILSTLLLLLAFRMLLSDSRSRFLVCAALHMMAMVVHQLAFLFFPVAIWAIARSDRPWIWKARQVILYLVVAGGGALLLYGAAYNIIASRLLPRPTFLGWITSHSRDSSFSFHLASNSAATLKSYARLFAGGRPSLLRGAMGTPKFIVSSLTASALAAGFYLRVDRLPDTLSKGRLSMRLARDYCLVWLGTYAAFLFFWLPNNTFYKIFLLPPLVLVAAIQCSLRTNRWRRLLAGGVAALFLVNFIVAIFPYSEVGNELVQFSFSLPAKLLPGSIVLYNQDVPDDWYMRYFTPQAHWIAVHDPVEAKVQYWSAKRQAGATIWVDRATASYLDSRAEPGDPRFRNCLRTKQGVAMLCRQ